MPKILIIEDDALLSRMYQTIFASNNYEVELATDGQEGLDKARSVNPTLILLDIMMPKLNGMEVLKQLKADPAVANLPVVVLTNLAGNSDVQTALELGAVRYIIKSEHKPKQVEEIVRGILAGYTKDEIPGAAGAA
ncbi:MAG TPA: response regulator [Candidatus Saccharimonadia bacterium]|nr:response regulator [Candidatus Saccharimonadia bacterium]